MLNFIPSPSLYLSIVQYYYYVNPLSVCFPSPVLIPFESFLLSIALSLHFIGIQTHRQTYLSTKVSSVNTHRQSYANTQNTVRFARTSKYTHTHTTHNRQVNVRALNEKKEKDGMRQTARGKT